MPETGTFWYHGHSGAIKLDGIYGAMNVHPKEQMQKKMRTHTFTWSEMEHTAVHNGGSEAFVSSLGLKNFTPSKSYYNTYHDIIYISYSF